jgi:hypothetical protein
VFKLGLRARLELATQLVERAEIPYLIICFLQLRLMVVDMAQVGGQKELWLVEMVVRVVVVDIMEIIHLGLQLADRHFLKQHQYKDFTVVMEIHH